MLEYTEREELNNGEKIVFNAIVEFFDKNKLPPTVRELCKLTGYKSTATIQNKLKSLELKGYVEINKREKRTLRIKAPAVLEKIDDSYTFYDGILRVICGNECKTIYLDAEYDEPVTLRDCYKMFPSEHLKEGEWLSPIVLFEDWTHGDIFRYGNHGAYWEKIGETIGFA